MKRIWIIINNLIEPDINSEYILQKEVLKCINTYVLAIPNKKNEN